MCATGKRGSGISVLQMRMRFGKDAKPPAGSVWQDVQNRSTALR